MNWLVLVLVGIGAVALVTFLVMRNIKDEKVIEKELNNDYRKTPDREGDVEEDEKI